MIPKSPPLPDRPPVNPVCRIPEHVFQPAGGLKGFKHPLLEMGGGVFSQAVAIGFRFDNARGEIFARIGIDPGLIRVILCGLLPVNVISHFFIDPEAG